MYHIFKILKLDILPRVYLHVSYGSHNNSINQLISLMEKKHVSYEAQTKFLYEI